MWNAGKGRDAAPPSNVCCHGGYILASASFLMCLLGLQCWWVHPTCCSIPLLLPSLIDLFLGLRQSGVNWSHSELRPRSVNGTQKKAWCTATPLAGAIHNLDPWFTTWFTRFGREKVPLCSTTPPLYSDKWPTASSMSPSTIRNMHAMTRPCYC